MTEILHELSAGTLILATLIMAAGAALQMAFGMGIALLVVPLLALLDVRFIPGPMLFAATGLSLAMACAGRKEIGRREIGIATIGLFVGTALGALALLAIPGSAMPRVFGAMILLAVLVSAGGAALTPTAQALFGGGTAAGIMGAMVGIHGPPIALIFQNDEPRRARAMLAAFFSIAYPLAILGMIAVGRFGMPELALGVALVPGVALGYILAPAVAHRVDRRVLRFGILVISAASGVALLVR
jgi:uncharacterized protein